MSNPEMKTAPWSQDRFLDALAFAARSHGGQTVPGTGFPYVTHLTSVAQEVMAALSVEAGRDGALAVTAALLHDVIEDTPTQPAEVEARFGARILAAVLALTKNPELPKDRRMADSLERILEQPAEVAMVKMADRIVNLAPPPGHWNEAKITAYGAEAKQILEALGPSSPYLANRLGERIAGYGPAPLS